MFDFLIDIIPRDEYSKNLFARVKTLKKWKFLFLAFLKSFDDLEANFVLFGWS